MPSGRTIAIRGFRSVLLGVLLAFVGLALVLWTQVEKRFVFFPSSEISYTPQRSGLPYEEVTFTGYDGLQLHGWYVPGRSDVTFLWFHGNGGNISHRVDEIEIIHHRLGVNLLIFDYSGYGKSEGTPSERGTYLDARAALAYLQTRSDLDVEKIVYFGRSLGAAVAVELATFESPLALVLVSPFASIADMARISLRNLPVQWLLRDRYDSYARIKGINRPLLILHGDQDKTVPISQGKKLFDAANQPKRFQVVLGAGHNDTYLAGRSGYWEALDVFLASLPASRASTIE